MTLALPLRTYFDKTEWHIRTVHIDIVKRMVADLHYAKRGSSWAVYTFGLFLRGDPNCWGVTWWIPAPKLSVDKYNPGGYRTTLILSRMVVHPLVPTNGASFLLGASVRRIAFKGRYTYLMTYADTWKGHSGKVYQAANWDYQGESKPTEIWLDSAGVLASRYCNGRIKSRAQMEREGYHFLGRFSKHIYTLQLKAKAQIEQLPLWEGSMTALGGEKDAA
jgi:hypothetical protein